MRDNGTIIELHRRLLYVLKEYAPGTMTMEEEILVKYALEAVNGTIDGLRHQGGLTWDAESDLTDEVETLGEILEVIGLRSNTSVAVKVVEMQLRHAILVLEAVKKAKWDREGGEARGAC